MPVRSFVNVRKALDIARRAGWQRPDPDFPEIVSRHMGLNETILRALGCVPGENLVYRIIDEDASREYTEWPSVLYGSPLQAGSVEWHIVGAPALRRMAGHGIPFPGHEQFSSRPALQPAP